MNAQKVQLGETGRRSELDAVDADPLVAEVRNAADALSRCLDMLGLQPGGTPGGDPETLFREIYGLRRSRDAIFPRLFGDPAWDILLHLYEDRRQGGSGTVFSAAEASGLTAVDGAYYVNAMIREGVLRPGAGEGEVEISDDGLAMMERWLAEASSTVRRWAYTWS
jgi:hypothetical protein